MRNSYNDIQTQNVLSNACSLYSIDKASLKKLDSFENLVYEGKRFDKPVILRLSESGHRTYHQILSELEFVEHLFKNGAPVINPITSNLGNLAEEVPCDGHYYTAIAYCKMTGRLAKKEDMGAILFEKMGRVTGLLHKIAESYKPSIPRPFFLDDHYYKVPSEFAGLDPEFYDIFEKNIEEMRPRFLAYPQILSHTDLHQGNFVLSGGKLKVFDFDDCAYAPHAFDIFIPAYYIARKCEQRKEDCMVFLRAFLKGYRKEHFFDPDWFGLFNYLLDLRAMVHYDATVQYIKHNQVSEVEAQRLKLLLGEALDRMKSGGHWVELDFPTLAETILE